MWTDDAVRIGPVPPAEVGKQAIREGNKRLTANKEARVLSYVPERREMIFLDGGWEVEWRPYTASFVTSPGGAPAQLRGIVLGVPRGCQTAVGKASAGRGSSAESL
jgi:hypothetical protein